MSPNNVGLKGVFAQFANVTAVLLICVMFYQDRHASMDMARQDREMYRDELRLQRSVMEQHHAVLERVSRNLETLIQEMKRGKK